MLINPPTSGTKTHFVGPAVTLVNSEKTELIYSRHYYDNPLFNEYDLSTKPTTWDIEATINSVPADARVLDLGGGDGRLTFAIDKAGKLRHADIVDISTIALEKCNNDAARRGISHKIRTFCENMFNLPAAVTEETYDVVLFGDVVLHYVYTVESLRNIFQIAARALSSKSAVIIATSFDDDSVTAPSILDGRFAAVPQRDAEGNVRLFWWSYKFDHSENTLYRTVFVETGQSSSGNLCGVISDLRDRLWSPAQLCSAARDAGLILKSKALGSVDDGAVAGTTMAISVFTRKDS